jgi:hypothetical protein
MFFRAILNNKLNKTLLVSVITRVHFIFIIFYMTDVTSGAELAYLSGTPKFTPVLQWGSCAQFLVFHVMFCGRVIVLPVLLFTAVNYPLILSFLCHCIACPSSIYGS